MTVKELAREEVVTVKPSVPISEVAHKMMTETVGSVVVEDGRKPVGILTDRDLVVRVLAKDKNPSNLEAKDLMTEDPVTIREEAGLYELAGKMSTDAVRRMPVVDTDGDLTGIITLDDLIVLLSDELQKLSEVIEFESPPY